MTAGGGVVFEPVAVVGPVWMLAWAGSGPIEPIVRSHGLKIGDGLYTLTQVRQVAELLAADKEYDEALRALIVANTAHGKRSTHPEVAAASERFRIAITRRAVSIAALESQS